MLSQKQIITSASNYDAIDKFKSNKRIAQFMKYDIPLSRNFEGLKLKDALALAAYMLGWDCQAQVGLPVPFTVPGSRDPIMVKMDREMTTLTIGDEMHELTGSKVYFHIPGILGTGILSKAVETTYIMHKSNYSALTLYSDRDLSKRDVQRLTSILNEILQYEPLEAGFTSPTLESFLRREYPPSMGEFISSRHENDLGGISTVFAGTVTYQGNVVDDEYKPKKMYAPYAALSFPDGTRAYPLDSSIARIKKGEVVVWESSKVPLEKRVLISTS